MNLYNDRNYNYVTDEEIKRLEEIKCIEKIGLNGKPMKFGRKIMYRDYPKAVKHNLSLFPNNFLDIEELKKEEALLNTVENFETIIDLNDTNERTILKFINQYGNYHIIASILYQYNFGHHGAYVFREFKLGTSYVADYLIIGKSSGGYEFIFVELQKPKGNITKKDGTFGSDIRDGLDQIDDWKRWLDSNYSTLYENFKKYKNKNIHKLDNETRILTDEFIKYDSTRMHFVVVAGRRSDFKANQEVTYSLKRALKKERNINLIHYDNLVDLSKKLVGKETY